MHVFEILRVDTSAVHLHYHKNGSLDDPVIVDPIGMPQNANSGIPKHTHTLETNNYTVKEN